MIKLSFREFCSFFNSHWLRKYGSIPKNRLCLKDFAIIMKLYKYKMFLTELLSRF